MFFLAPLKGIARYIRWATSIPFKGARRRTTKISTFRLLKDPYEHEHKTMTDTCINLKTGWAWHATI